MNYGEKALLKLLKIFLKMSKKEYIKLYNEAKNGDTKRKR